MKKIIFEQVGNILIAILFTIASIQTVIQSNFNTEKDGSSFILFGYWWFIAFFVCIVFSILRYFFQKSKSGYSKQTAELSFQDEREKLICDTSTRWTYSFLKYYLVTLLVVALYLNIFLQDILSLRIANILMISISLITLFSSYLLSWIILDNKI